MSPFWQRELLNAGMVALLFGLVFAAAEAWRALGSPRPEWTRKLVHFGGGLICLALPWLVRSHWTVLGLALGFGAIIVGSRRLRLLGSVHGVERRSEGGLYFPLAVYGMFLLAARQPVYYLVSMLALVVSDALAALVGSTYGRLGYQVESDRRSVEGSAVFFLTTFLSLHLPLLLLTPMGRAESVLIPAQIALLVTLLEAISLEGNDNLIVPIGTYLLLLKLTPQSAETILWQLVAQLLILVLLFVVAWRSRLLTAAGTLAASLFFYAAWSLAGPAWVLAPAAGLLCFALLLRRAVRERHGPESSFQVRAVFYTTLVPVALVIVHNLHLTVLRGSPGAAWLPAYPLYLGALAGQLAVLTLVFTAGTPWVATASPRRVAAAYLVGVAGVIPVGLLALPGPAARASAALVPALAIAAYLLANRRALVPRSRPWDGRLQAGSVALASALAAPLLALVASASTP